MLVAHSFLSAQVGNLGEWLTRQDDPKQTLTDLYHVLPWTLRGNYAFLKRI